MEGEREEEKHQGVVAFHAPPTGDLAHSPGMCPDWELNQHHFGLQAHASSTELHQPGQICIKFCGKLEHSSVETIWMIQKDLGDNAMSAVQIKAWHKCFKDGLGSVKSDPHSGRPTINRTPENVERVQAAINEDWQSR